jgi:hypothetical protein
MISNRQTDQNDLSSDSTDHLIAESFMRLRDAQHRMAAPGK